MKIAKILGILVTVVAVLIGGLLAFLATLDVNKYKPMIVEEAKKATGRDLAIGGNLSLKVSLSPALVVENVTFANMPGGSRPEMVTMKRFEAEVALLPLLHGGIQVNRLVLIEPDILIETDKHGKGNWVMGPAESAPAPAAKKEEAPQPAAKSGGLPNVAIEEIRIEKAVFVNRDGAAGTSMKVDIDHLVLRAKSLAGPLSIDLAGALDGKAFEVKGTTGPIADLMAQKPWPLDIGAKATFVLPVPIQLAGTLTMGDKVYAIDNLKLGLGKSALAGSAKVAIAAKPKATVRLASDLIDLAEIAPGSDKKASDKKEVPPAKKAGDGRVFPADPLSLDGLRAVDVDAEVKIGKLILPSKLALEGINAKLLLNNGRLETKPFALKLGGGDVATNLVLDASSGSSASLNLNVVGKQVMAGNIAKDMGNSDMFTGGPTDINIDLRGQGGSVRSLMAGLNGTIQIVMGQGRVNNTLINWGGGDILTQLTNSLNPTAKKEDYTPISCGVVNFKVQNGMANASKGIAFETNMLDIVGDGTANLKTEGLDFGIKPTVKEGLGVGVGNLASMVRLRGTMANPTVGIDTAEAAKTALKTGAAVASGGLSVLGGALLDKTGATSQASGPPCQVALGKGMAAKQEAAKPAANSVPAQKSSNPADAAKGTIKGLFGR
ncbi:MAG: AsmA family protein [Gammaproteobacteria bacterium]|nr:AsmA family protein [Gammaproteobacteria bacterium]MBU1655682.1 AsmA family protein [Gammaproteobacteria bacterium]MBU1961170.1 AsmA family protein [Gammaproteobacteria bacterium]